MHYGKTRNHSMSFRLAFPEIWYIRGSLSTGEMQDQLCTELFLIIWELPKTLRKKTQKVQCKKPLIVHQCWSPSYIQLVFFSNPVLHNTKKMLNFHQRYLDQTVHCSNLLALALTGELHVADGGIWSKKVLMYSNWSLKKIFD